MLVVDGARERLEMALYREVLDSGREFSSLSEDGAVEADYCIVRVFFEYQTEMGASSYCI